MAEMTEKLTEVLETLELMPDRNERIEFLIDTADRFKPVEESVATRPFPESNRVQPADTSPIERTPADNIPNDTTPSVYCPKAKTPMADPPKAITPVALSP